VRRSGHGGHGQPTRLERGHLAGLRSGVGDQLVHVGASQFPPLVRVGPTFVPGRRGCLDCLEQSARRRDPLFDELADWREGADTLAATFAPACALIGGVLSGDVIHHLTGLAEPATLGASLLFDIRTFERRRLPVEPVPGCRICAGG
jgi:bacteriocin biosynthesis cyclodehydratase domain-containing protein